MRVVERREAQVNSTRMIVSLRKTEVILEISVYNYTKLE